MTPMFREPLKKTQSYFLQRPRKHRTATLIRDFSLTLGKLMKVTMGLGKTLTKCEKLKLKLVFLKLKINKMALEVAFEWHGIQ